MNTILIVIAAIMLLSTLICYACIRVGSDYDRRE